MRELRANITSSQGRRIEINNVVEALCYKQQASDIAVFIRISRKKSKISNNEVDEVLTTRNE